LTATNDVVRPTAVVRLTLPATPEFIRLARLTAAGLASRLGFTLDELQDIRIAVDELCFLLVGPDGRVGTVELTYESTDGSLVVEGRGASPTPPTELSAMSARILGVVAEEFGVTRDGDHVHFRLVHRRRSA
jgi:serine/threonine-protein kinase RsbW